MYRITDKNFHTSDYGDDKYLTDWPMLYILDNGKEAYIGESTNITNRMMQHKADEKKDKFQNVHLIYSKEFNRSVTIDYEAQLIRLFAADEKYIITNKNAGIANKNYFNKAYYDKSFNSLWERLRNKKLAKHTIDEITNSDLFKYSPYKELNDGQREAVEEIFRSIMLNPEQAVVVNGIPGSGKTIVAVFLFKFLRDYVDEQGNQPYIGKKIAIVIPQTSLRKTLKNLFKHIYGLKASDVIGPSEIAKHQYDIVLVDEAHRLHQRKNITNYQAHDINNRILDLPPDSTELDWIFKQVKCPILFYDKNQVVGPSGINHEMLDTKIKNSFYNRMITYHNLFTQMRVKGGNEYISYISDILNNSASQKKTFQNYEFKIVDSFEIFESLLLEKEREKGLSRMIAGYAWPWISKKDKNLKDIHIEDSFRMWNNRTENWVHSGGAIDEVGCIHSIQGYDLNYAFVILGNDVKFDTDKECIIVDKGNYFDMKGKNTATNDELLSYIKNIYYILMTRGIEGTYLYVCNPVLKVYLQKYIDMI